MTNAYTTLEEIKELRETSQPKNDFWTLRPEQREAIDMTKEHFCSRRGTKGNYVYTPKDNYAHFLWNAKMRFGKTICALQLAREMGVKRTLIITHRPVVNANFKEDFRNVVEGKIKGNTSLKDFYDYGTLSDDAQVDKRKFYDLEDWVEKDDNNHYVFFVSMQYIRLAEILNENTKAKNQEKKETTQSGHSATAENEKLKADILNTDWDFVIVDEAHEGTNTSLGAKVIDYLKKKSTKMLHLSGTPYKMLVSNEFKDNEIFTWDYISEQEAKRRWTIEHPNEKNPYAELPQMKIFTYDIRNNLQNVLNHEGIFTFQEFFRTWTGNPKADRASMPEGALGRFVHEEEVKKFLDLLCTKNDTNNFPFSTVEYRKEFKHTFWVLTHVNEAKALEMLLNEHSTFKKFTIINVAGESADEEGNSKALENVKKKMGEVPENTNTITLSCTRLTTGVTVKPWTAVLYLRSGDSAASYMQTIFRAQSPYVTPEGKMKTTCYVFDFAPDRVLKIVAETAKYSSIAKRKEKEEAEGDEKKTQEMRDKETVSDFISLCPLISMDGGAMAPMDVNRIYSQLENVFIDRLVRNGFDDDCLYNQEELNKIDTDLIKDLGDRGGAAPGESPKKPTTIDFSKMTPEERKQYEEHQKQIKAAAEQKAKERAAEKAKQDEEFKKKWDSWTDEERKDWENKEAERIAHNEELRRKREEFKKRVSNIRGIALRIPLLMYGGADAGDPNDVMTIDNFTRKIKDESWKEFLPKDITKEDFNKIKKCFNATRFEEAGKRYRAITREADFVHIHDRIKTITEIFSYFRNPDKETVLTPWRVVNMHMSDTIGGYCFFDEGFDEKAGQLEHPRYVDQGDVTSQLFDTVTLGGEIETQILEINSKTGLYPLYVTYTLFRRRIKEYIRTELFDLKQSYSDITVRYNNEDVLLSTLVDQIKSSSEETPDIRQKWEVVINAFIENDIISVAEEQVVWDDIVSQNLFVICNTPMAVGITRRTLFGFRQIEQRANIKSEKLIEKATSDQQALIKELKSEGFWKGTTSKKEMKFNAIVGNPPYQVMDGGAQASAKPIYNVFVEIAKSLKSNYLSLIMPARWYSGGKGLDEFRSTMLSDIRIRRLDDFLYPETIFPNTNIRGGLCYFLRDENYDNNEKLTQVVTHGENGVISDKMRRIKIENFDTFIRTYEAISIIEKVRKSNFVSIADNISARKPFGLATDFFKSEDYKDSNIGMRDPILCYSKGMRVGYIERDKISIHQNWIDKWKVLIPRANNIGTELNDDNLNSFICAPKEVTTESYLVVGGDLSLDKVMCSNIKSYFSTKFVRFLHSMSKSSQDATSKTFQFVPLQDFSKPWTDEELYEKYGLDMFERAYIEGLIKPME